VPLGLVAAIQAGSVERGLEVAGVTARPQAHGFPF
jgi:hypothetical protein